MFRRIFTPTLFVLTFFVSFSISQEPSRNPVEENPIIEELQQISDKETVDRFVAATAALDSGRNEEAEKLYKEVLQKAPDFEAALRRLGYTYIRMGKRQEGLDMTARALAKNRSVDNLIGRAGSLLSSPSPDHKFTDAEIGEALALAREAWQKSNYTDEESGTFIAETLLMSEQYAEFKKFAPILTQKLPDSAGAAYYNAMALAENGDLDGAETEIARSKALGAPDEAVVPLTTAINTARDEEFFGLGRFRRYAYLVFGLVAFWAAGLVALFVVGWQLSKKTLRSIETSDPNDITGEAHSSLKKIYRRVVSIAGIYYYFSQPFVIFLVVAFTVIVVFFFLWIGRIPIYFVLLLVFGGAASIFYMIKSLVTRVKLDDPGRALTEAEAPGLWQLVRNVAEVIKTRPVNEIRITHGSDLAVYERGSFRAKMSDHADRILVLGTAVLNGFDQNAFRAVLAHEYGHFSNRDTAGGDIAYRVNTDIARIAEQMVASETNTYYNIGFHFLRLFHFLFRRITHGASRLQEVLADRVAAYHFGADSFREGLRHVIRRELEFTHVAEKEISSALGANRAFTNLYELTVTDNAAEKQIEEAFAQVLEQETTEDDTHPSPRDRFRYIEGARSAGIEPVQGNVWNLFADRDAITAEMNAVIEKLVRPSYQQSDSTLGI
jgi:Zn-dependent protease with chaperone function